MLWLLYPQRRRAITNGWCRRCLLQLRSIGGGVVVSSSSSHDYGGVVQQEALPRSRTNGTTSFRCSFYSTTVRPRSWMLLMNHQLHQLRIRNLLHEQQLMRGQQLRGMVVVNVDIPQQPQAPLLLSQLMQARNYYYTSSIRTTSSSSSSPTTNDTTTTTTTTTTNSSSDATRRRRRHHPKDTSAPTTGDGDGGDMRNDNNSDASSPSSKQHQQQHAPSQHPLQLLDSTTTNPNLNLTDTVNNIVGSSSNHGRDNSNNNNGLFRLLSDTERQLLQQQQEIIQHVKDIAAKVGISTRDYYYFYSPNDSSLNQKTNQLDLTNTNNDNNTTAQAEPDNITQLLQSTFCVVVVGEYNAGKSTLINALLSTSSSSTTPPLLETGSLPTTDQLMIVSYDDENNNNNNHPTNDGNSIQYIKCSVPILQDLTIVDTPGTNTVLDHHTTLTVRILPVADLILFVTSADRPFPQSERQLLESLAQFYRKNIVLIINKMDILDTTGGIHGSSEKQRVVQYVSNHASSMLGPQPIVIALSARDAYTARQRQQSTQQQQQPTSSPLWERSNMAQLEHYLYETLSTRTKIKAKLSSPIHVTLGLLQQCTTQLQQERDALQSDIATLQLLQNQLTSWDKEMTVLMDQSKHDIQQILYHEGQRSHIFLSRIFNNNWWNFYTSCCFGSTLQLQQEWNNTKPLGYALSHSPKSSSSTGSTSTSTPTMQNGLLDLVRDASDRIAVRGRTQGQSIIEFLGQRPRSSHNISLVGSITAASSYGDTQRHVHDALQIAVTRHIPSSDTESHDETQFLHNLQRIAWLSMSLNAIGIVSIAATYWSWLDVIPGVSIVSTMMVSSVSSMWIGPQYFAQQYSTVWNLRSQRLGQDIHTLLTQETQRIQRRIQDGVSPYTRFVQTEQDRIDTLTDECHTTTASAQQLLKRISNLE